MAFTKHHTQIAFFIPFKKKSLQWKRGDSSAITMSSYLIFTFIILLCLLSSSFSSSASLHNATNESVTFRPQHEIQKLKLIREHLQKINKPAIKTIQVKSKLSSFFFMCKLSSETCVRLQRHYVIFKDFFSKK